ncbi:MAG: hypothetical protein GY869_08415 [Planctomycetes bacterium]|nr:hypothetical protein [Planctomycetota bacterium]
MRQSILVSAVMMLVVTCAQAQENQAAQLKQPFRMLLESWSAWWQDEIPANNEEGLQLKLQVEQLNKQVKELQTIIQGTAHPINLGRTSLAAVHASDVNFSRALDNQHYGIQNAFDDGDNWINNINYTYWMGSSTQPWVELYFDHPVTVSTIHVESAASYTPIFGFVASGEEPYPVQTDSYKLAAPLHGVNRVKLEFEPDTGNLKVLEIRIMGYVGEGINYEVKKPRIYFTPDTALPTAKGIFDTWYASISNKAPVFSEDENYFIYTFLFNDLEVYQVSIHKKTSKISSKQLAKWTGIKTEAVIKRNCLLEINECI